MINEESKIFNLYVRLNVRERRQLEEDAKKHEMNVSEYVRYKLFSKDKQPDSEQF